MTIWRFCCRLELQGHEVRSVYLAACYLKMNRIAEECAKYLIKNLSVDNCIDIRSLPGISSKKTFVCQLDDFISTMVSIKENFFNSAKRVISVN